MPKHAARCRHDPRAKQPQILSRPSGRRRSRLAHVPSPMERRIGRFLWLPERGRSLAGMGRDTRKAHVLILYRSGTYSSVRLVSPRDHLSSRSSPPADTARRRPCRRPASHHPQRHLALGRTSPMGPAHDKRHISVIQTISPLQPNSGYSARKSPVFEMASVTTLALVQIEIIHHDDR